MGDPCKKCDTLEKRNAFLRDNPQQILNILKDITSSDPLLKQGVLFNTGEEQLKAVLDSSSDRILVWDKAHNCLYANPAAIDLMKTTPDKVIGRNIRDGLGHTPDFMRLWLSRIDEVFKIGKPMRVTDTASVGDRMVYSESVLSPIRYPNGQLFAVGVVYRDMTQQKELEISLRNSENRFTAIFRGAGVGILVANIENRRFIEANPAICQMLGYTREELLHLGVEDIHPKEALDDVINVFGEIVTGEKTNYEQPCLRKDGSILHCRINGTLFDIAEKKQVIGFFSDITEQKKLQQKLMENVKKYHQLYDQAQIPLCRTRISDGKLLECNQAMAALLGYSSKEECLAEHYSSSHYIDPARRTELLTRLEEVGFVSGFEIEFTRMDGMRFWSEITARIYPLQGCIEKAVLDITASKVLSKSEKKILNLIMLGKCNKEIARILGRSVRTIEDHRTHIMHKLHVHNLVELVQKAQSFKSEE